MIQFGRFEIRSVPDQEPFTAFAPSFDELEKREDYIAWFKANSPRSIKIIENRFWDRLNEENRNATQDEVDNYVNTGMHNGFLKTQPFTSYKHFGNKSILGPLQQKLNAEYEGYVAQWREWFESDREVFYKQLERVCTIKTVYENLSKSMDYYPSEYMQELLKTDESLKAVSEAYIKYIGWNAEPMVMEILRTAKNSASIGKLNPKASEKQVYDGHIECLTKAAETEYAEYEKKWQSDEFENTLLHTVRIFSIRQIYNEIKNNIGAYPDDKVYALGSFERPIAYDLYRVVCERKIRTETVDELNEVLPEMFPNVQTETDIWGLWKRRYKPEFTVKEGLESNYRDFAISNSDGYGSAIIRYMNRWGNMMEAEIANGSTVADAAATTQYIADKDGITGFMYNCAVQGLSEFWKYGEELRQWHNQRYSYNGVGVVNSCIINLPSDNTEIGTSDTVDESPKMGM